MSSETVTRNDLTAILNEVLPPTPSEYKKLLWTNPSPTSNFPTQALLNGQDLTVYDAIEVIGVNYDGYGSIMPPLQIPIGGKGNLIGLAGSTGDSAGMGFLVMRGISANTNSIVVSGAMGVSTNGTSWSANDNNMVPVRIYGIKYERVAPPQLDASDYVIEQDVKTASDGTVWNCRKWNSGVAECWCKVLHTITGWQSWYSWYYSRPDTTKFSFPTNFFIDVPIVEASRSSGIAGVLCEEGAPSATQTQQYYLIRPDAPSANGFNLDIHAIGKWK